MTTDTKRDDTTALATEVYLLMSDLVLDHQRRRELADTVGLSFDRTRALRRLARRPMCMTELAATLGIDKPNATTLVDELELRGLATRSPHPTDRRSKVVKTTAEGNRLAAKADWILGRPPTALAELDPEVLQTLRAILKDVVAAERS